MLNFYSQYIHSIARPERAVFNLGTLLSKTMYCRLAVSKEAAIGDFNYSLQDIIAVGYGTFKAEEDRTGLICCWSIKNPQVCTCIIWS